MCVCVAPDRSLINALPVSPVSAHTQSSRHCWQAAFGGRQRRACMCEHPSSLHTGGAGQFNGSCLLAVDLGSLMEASMMLQHAASCVQEHGLPVRGS